MRDKIVAGNWKMNNNQFQTKELLNNIKSFEILNDVRVMVAPSFTQLSQSKELLSNTSISVVAQNINAAISGAYTGEVSADMLKGIGVTTTLIGHSERRSIFYETDRIIKEKVKAALAADMEVIFCFGEQLADRKSNNHFRVVASQLEAALFDLPETLWNRIILAYEPVWAIGTGETATPEQAQEMHKYIRNLIEENYNQIIAENVAILYGGSVKPNNAKEIFSGKDVDGGLIGGASLKAADFIEIVSSF
jgi:triosephosphate isomerase